jgi:hypothetical protein
MDNRKATEIRGMTANELDLVSGGTKIISGSFNVLGVRIHWAVAENDTATATTVCVSNDTSPATCGTGVTPK